MAGGGRAFVLAAGLGTRLRPLTETWPKPAVPFLGAPLLRRAIGLNAPRNDLNAAAPRALGATDGVCLPALGCND